MTRQFDHTKIKPLREGRGMSQRAFADASGIPLDTVRMYEQGRTVPSVERLAIIANTLGCAVDALFTDEG